MKTRYIRLKIHVLFFSSIVTLIAVLGVNVIIEGLSLCLRDYKEVSDFGTMIQTYGIEYNLAKKIHYIIFIDKTFMLWMVGHLVLLGTYVHFTVVVARKCMDQVENAIMNLYDGGTKPTILPAGLGGVEDALNRMKMKHKDMEIKASEGKRRQNELIMFLAHDLKTPLTSIVAYLTMIATNDELSKEEEKKYVQTALDKSNRLGELISEFFEIAKYNMQNIKLDKEIFDVSMMLEQIADEFYGVMSEKGLECRVEAQEGLIINGDTDKLARVFENILRNAVNYCRENSMITIRAMIHGDYVEITIANEGEKIPDEKLFTIFEKFYRLDDARSSTTGGSGLGLAISKEIVQLHEGVIFAESDPNETRFIIRIPKLD